MKRILNVVLFGIAATGMCSAVKMPVFMWGSPNFFQPAPDGDLRRVSYQGEDMSSLHTAVTTMLRGTDFDALPSSMRHMFKQSEQPHVTVLFHGSEAHGETIGKHPQLHATLQDALASVSIPYVNQDGTGDVRAMLLAQAEAAASHGSKLHFIGNCGSATASSISLGDLPELGGDQRTVVVVCPTSAESGGAQMATLERLSQAVKQTGLTNMFVFVADPGHKSEGSGRSLMATTTEGALTQSGEDVAAPTPDAPKGLVCDKTCRTQVNQLEAFILLATLLAALGMGICCMGILDGPTRFEAQKED